MVDVLDEAGGAERVRLIEDFIADPAAARYARLGELHSQPQHLVLGNQDDRALVLELVGNALTLQVLHDGGGILHRQVGEEGRHLRSGDAQDEDGEKADKRHGDCTHGGDARRPERLDERGQPLHRTSLRTRYEPN